MATEGVTLEFTPDAIERIAELATLVNERTENIGARRLHTVMERLLDEVSFHAPELGGRSIRIDARVRRSHARRHREERRSVAVHPVTRRAGRCGGRRAWWCCRGRPRCGKQGPAAAAAAPAARAHRRRSPLQRDRRPRRAARSPCRPRTATASTPSAVERVEIFALVAAAADAAADARAADSTPRTCNRA